MCVRACVTTKDTPYDLLIFQHVVLNLAIASTYVYFLPYKLGFGQAFMLGIIGSKQVALGRDIDLQLAATLTPRVFLFYLVSKSQDYGQGGAVSE